MFNMSFCFQQEFLLSTGDVLLDSQQSTFCNSPLDQSSIAKSRNLKIISTGPHFLAQVTLGILVDRRVVGSMWAVVQAHTLTAVPMVMGNT